MLLIVSSLQLGPNKRVLSNSKLPGCVQLFLVVSYHNNNITVFTRPSGIGLQSPDFKTKHPEKE